MIKEKLSDPFVSPEYSSSFLAEAVVRRAILRELRNAAPDLYGVLLDVGCGQMPYRKMLLSPPFRVEKYIGLDLGSNHYASVAPDLVWNGERIPLEDRSVDSAIATEVLEHCPDPARVLSEVYRTLRPGGRMFLTVPFLWSLHDVPNDEYRYTPFALRRHLEHAGFSTIRLRALGGWDAALAVIIGLWTLRRPMRPRRRRIVGRLVVPLVRRLAERDRPPQEFLEGQMITGLAATAQK